MAQLIRRKDIRLDELLSQLNIQLNSSNTDLINKLDELKSSLNNSAENITNNEYITNNNDNTNYNDYITNNSTTNNNDYITNNNTDYITNNDNRVVNNYTTNTYKTGTELNVKLNNNYHLIRKEYKTPEINLKYNIIKETECQNIRIKYIVKYLIDAYKYGSIEDIIIIEKCNGYWDVKIYYNNGTIRGTYLHKNKANKIINIRRQELSL
jgi:hypothetical protein